MTHLSQFLRPTGPHLNLQRASDLRASGKSVARCGRWEIEYAPIMNLTLRGWIAPLIFLAILGAGCSGSDPVADENYFTALAAGIAPTQRLTEAYDLAEKEIYGGTWAVPTSASEAGMGDDDLNAIFNAADRAVQGLNPPNKLSKVNDYAKSVLVERKSAILKLDSAYARWNLSRAGQFLGAEALRAQFSEERSRVKALLQGQFEKLSSLIAEAGKSSSSFRAIWRQETKPVLRD